MGSKKIKPRLSINQKKLSMNVQCYLMLLLPLIGFFVFTVYPILWTFKWSLFSYNGILSSTKFIGLDNFKKMFTTDFTYWKVWGNTFLFAILKMPLELIIAMVIALLLNQKFKGSNFFRSAYYLPNVVSVVIIGLIFSNLFSFFGFFNALLKGLGLITKEIDWFASKKTAMTVLVVASVWNTFGINVMYLLAALSNVPEEVYESASLDGAGPVRVFFSITLPLIAPVFQIIVLLSLVGTLSVNEFVLILTGGAPGGKTFTVMSYLTKQFVPGFAESSNPSIGYGCAMSLVTTVIFGVVAFLYNKFSNKMSNLY